GRRGIRADVDTRGRGPAALDLIEQFARGCVIQITAVKIGERAPGDQQERQEREPIGHGRDARIARKRAVDGGDGLHDRGVNTGSMRASMWKCSPGSEGERVVGAKKVARVKCCDCSMSRISEGASRVTPTTCILSPWMRSSVT